MLKGTVQTGAPAPEGEVPSMTLGQYLAEAGKAVRTGIPKAWVEAIVLDVKASGGGLRVELVEPSADESDDGRRADQRDGRLQGMIWSRTAKEIESAIGMPLDPATLKGALVRMLVKTTFHKRWHLEGEILDLDPQVVQALIQRRLEMIREKLRAAGHWGRQQSLPAPLDVMSIAVIHPDKSAGWADVRAELERLAASGVLTVQSHPVPFEGRGAADGITKTLAAIATGVLPDLVLIVRGGGAASGFAGLVDLALARAVCLCPVPIVTGIGHASDRTILDDCAWRAADTPSKALGTVKSILRQHLAAARDAHRAILDSTAFRIGGTLEPLLTNWRSALVEAAEKVTAGQSARLRDLAHGIERHLVVFRGSIDLTQAELDRAAADLIVMAPAVPRRADAELSTLRAGLLQSASRRLPDRGTLAAQAQHASGVVAAFVARQAVELKVALAAMETAMRRRLGEESARLAAAGAAVKALDLEAVLSRGFILPLDDERRIIRSAEVAQRAAGFELLFVDGQVRVQPDARPTMP